MAEKLAEKFPAIDGNKDQLHPEILLAIRDTLAQWHPHAWLTWQHDRIPTASEILSALSSIESDMREIFGQIPQLSFHRSIREYVPRVAKTVTVHRKNGSVFGLATQFDAKDTEITPDRLRLVLVHSNNPEDRKPSVGASSLVVGRPDEGLLEQIGATPGIIGPWTRRNETIPVFLLENTDPLTNRQFAVVDFALSEDTSLVIFGAHAAEIFIARVNALLGCAPPILVREPEAGWVDSRGTYHSDPRPV